MGEVSNRAQELADEGRWVEARDLLERLDPEQLAPADHELLAIASGLTGRDDQAAQAWEHAHAGWHAAGDARRSARSAFWLGMAFVNRRQMAPGMGWFQRGQRVLEEVGAEASEAALLQVPVALQHLRKDPQRALELFDGILEVATRLGDREAVAFGRLGSGQALIQLGDAPQGVALLDEAMTAAMAGDVSPIAVGIIYCAVILECRRAFDLRRAREWTRTLSAWCDRQQGLVPFRGQCLVHRSEVAQIEGDWATAWDEAEAACDHLADIHGDPLLGLALYQRAELRRLRGEFEEAAEDYAQASAAGRRAEPGLQLLLLAQGRQDEAVAMISRCRAEASGPVQRTRILAAFVKIMLATGDVRAARDASDELGTLAEEADSNQLRATARQCAGAVLLEEGDPNGALNELAAAGDLWRQLGAPYEIAHVRLLRATACERVGDDVTAELEREAALKSLESLGAHADLAAMRKVGEPATSPGGLSSREIEVIELVAKGMTNKQIAADLVISEKTVARHISNIFTKIGVGSRSAATAWAFKQGLVDT